MIRGAFPLLVFISSLSGQVAALPHPPDGAGTEWYREFATTQVGTRTAAFSIDASSAANLWSEIATLVGVSTEWRPLPAVHFGGQRSSALNRLISDVNVLSIHLAAGNLILDEPIRIERSNLQIDFGGATLHPLSGHPYAIRIEHATRVLLSNVSIANADAGILVNASDSVLIERSTISGARSHGIVVTLSNRVVVRYNRIDNGNGAGIVLHRDSRRNLVEANDITNQTGASNHTAGILVTDRAVDLAANPRAVFGPDQYWAVSQPMVARPTPPQENWITRNRISSNRSSGIYLDGAVQNVVSGNVIERNSKEGLCLDNGSVANVVADNTITANGRRWGQSDQALALDYVLASGRLSDGTAAAKVPGISIDNAAYNLIYSNRVEGNYGGGIKIVRTGFFNTISLNSVVNNNAGSGPDFHFFGVELGSAPGDDVSEELDFKSSRGNVVFSNVIRGSHFAGIFFGSRSDANRVEENIVMGAEQWAVEAAAQGLANNLQRNLTDKPNRNIGDDSLSGGQR